MDSEPTRTDGQGAGPGLPVCLHACVPAASGSARLQFDFAPSFHPNEERAGVRGPGLCLALLALVVLSLCLVLPP